MGRRYRLVSTQGAGNIQTDRTARHHIKQSDPHELKQTDETIDKERCIIAMRGKYSKTGTTGARGPPCHWVSPTDILIQQPRTDISNFLRTAKFWKASTNNFADSRGTFTCRPRQTRLVQTGTECRGPTSNGLKIEPNSQTCFLNFKTHHYASQQSDTQSNPTFAN